MVVTFAYGTGRAPESLVCTTRFPPSVVTSPLTVFLSGITTYSGFSDFTSAMDGHFTLISPAKSVLNVSSFPSELTTVPVKWSPFLSTSVSARAADAKTDNSPTARKKRTRFISSPSGILDYVQGRTAAGAARQVSTTRTQKTTIKCGPAGRHTCYERDVA